MIPTSFVSFHLLMVLLLGSLGNFCVINAEGHGTAAAAAGVDCTKPPLDVHPKDCCRMPPLLDESLLIGCKQIHGAEELHRGSLIHERGSCFIECAMNATGTLVNGVLDQQKITQLVTARTGSNPAMTQVFVASCVKCFQASQQNAGPFHSVDSKHCRPTASRFISCVNMETFKMCLSDLWTNSNSCNSLRKYIESCPIPT